MSDKPEVEKEVAHASRGHHPTSPSSLNSLDYSPCYVSRSGDNEASRLGTLQHEAVETGELDNELDDDHADAVARAISMTTQLKDLLRSQGHNPLELVEQYLPIDDHVSYDAEGRLWQGTTGGFPDRVILYQSSPGQWHVYVLDWKFGRYAVTNARDNRQGQAYALGVAWLLQTGHLHPSIPRGAKVSGATVVFVSPHRDEDPNQAEFTPADLDSAYNDIVQIVERTQATRAVIAAKGFGEDNMSAFFTSQGTCLFCAEVGRCPAVRALVQRTSKKYAPLKVPDKVLGLGITDMDEAAELVKLTALAKTWAEATRKRITDQAFEDPTKVPSGHAIRTSYPINVLKPVEMFDYLVKRFGREKVHEHVKVPITPFDKAVAEAAERGQKGAATDQFREDLTKAGLIETSTVPTVSLRMK